jgi:DNA-binding winged helix-turn-helix (wHTH) protein
MALPLPSLRQGQADSLMSILATGQCCALFGLSNTGKSPLLRSLALPASQQRYGQVIGERAALVYVDCNRVVELSAIGFYEVVIRTLLEFIEDPETPPAPSADLLARLRDDHNRITGGPLFHSALAFNDALAETGGQLGINLVLLFDEFDEIYASLEDRTLLNLRALKDHNPVRLNYVTATVRPLAETRTPGDNEFAELFAAHTMPLGLLSPDDARAVVDSLSGGALPAPLAEAVLRLGGGHLGLLTALSQAARRAPPAGDDARHLMGDATARAECLKLWNQLRPDEHQALASLLAAPAEGLAGPVLDRLRALGLVTGAPRSPQLFSELFAAFVRRQTALPAEAAQGVLVDHDAGEVWVDGARVSLLTDLEFKLMRLLYDRRDRLTTKDMIVETVWGGEYLDRVDDARIEKLVSRLRSKIEPDPARPRYLLTQRGRGYKLSRLPVARTEEDDV